RCRAGRRFRPGSRRSRGAEAIDPRAPHGSGPGPCPTCGQEASPRVDPGGSASNTSGVRQHDLAVLDPDQVDAGMALAAFLTGRAGFFELDLAIHPSQLDLPERRADRFRVHLARLGDGGRNRTNAVITAEALGQPGERIAAL